MSRFGRIVAVVFAGAIIVAAPALISPYALRVLVLAMISAIAVIGLTFAFGYAGLVHLGQAAFVGVGAYTTAILSTRYGYDVWITMPAALVTSALASVIVGAPMLRLRGHSRAGDCRVQRDGRDRREELDGF